MADERWTKEEIDVELGHAPHIAETVTMQGVKLHALLLTAKAGLWVSVEDRLPCRETDGRIPVVMRLTRCGTSVIGAESFLKLTRKGLGWFNDESYGVVTHWLNVELPTEGEEKR